MFRCLRLVTFIFLITTLKLYAITPINSSYWTNTAIEGYDPVAYFTDNKAIEGNSNYTYEWKNANWKFSSQDHLNMFRNDPEKYSPQYGGYCAWAVGHGYTASIDPKAWNIVKGKLYLNYNKEVEEKWKLDKINLIKQANKNWPKLLKKES